MSSPDYTLQKLFEAVDRLAAGTGRIQDRLGSTVACLAVLQPEDFSDFEDKGLSGYADFQLAMRRVEDSHGGSWMASAAAMSDDEASKWASLLVRLLLAATREADRRARSGGQA